MSVVEADLGTQTQTPPAEPTPAVTTPPPDWRASLPEELRAHPSLADVKDVGGLAKRFIDTKAMVGQRPEGLKVPSAASTPEEIKAFHKALGVPDTPGQYMVKRPAVALETGWDEGLEGQFLTAMHAKGATPAVVQAAIDFHGATIAAQLDRGKAQARNDQVSLRNEWGANYEARFGLVQRTMDYMADHTPGFADWARRSGAVDSPAFIRAIAPLAELMQEASMLSGETVQGLTGEAALAQIAELKTERNKHPEGSTQAAEINNKIIGLQIAANRNSLKRG